LLAGVRYGHSSSGVSDLWERLLVRGKVSTPIVPQADEAADNPVPCIPNRLQLSVATASEVDVEVEPALLAIAGAASWGDDGLLSILLDRESESSLKLFGTEAVEHLVVYKWYKYGFKSFVAEMITHFTIVFSWTSLTLRVATTPDPLFASVSDNHAALACLCCFVSGFVLWDGARVLWMKAIVEDNRRCYFFSVLAFSSLVFLCVLACLLLLSTEPDSVGNAQHPLETVALTVLMVCTAKSVRYEIKQIQASGWKSYMNNLWNATDVVSLSLVVLVVGRMLFGYGQGGAVRYDRGLTIELATVNTLLLWFRVVNYFLGFDSTAVFVTVFVKMLANISVFVGFVR